MAYNNNLIIVTGFGPFVGHEDVNASWEAVKLLPDEIKVRQNVFIIKKIEIPVVYKEVDKIVQEIWEECPLLVIHCGVHGKAKHIRIEKLAYNTCFPRPDFLKNCLSCSKAKLINNPDSTMLSTTLDVPRMVNELNLEIEEYYRQMFICSTTIGNYLCAYIYLKSLDIDENRSLFIHVPPVDSPFSTDDTMNAILAVIQKSIVQLIERQLIINEMPNNNEGIESTLDTIENACCSERL